jgi:hypothetical protein
MITMTPGRPLKYLPIIGTSVYVQKLIGLNIFSLEQTPLFVVGR